MVVFKDSKRLCAFPLQRSRQGDRLWCHDLQSDSQDGSGQNPSTVCFLPLNQTWPVGLFVQQEEPFGCVLLTFQDYDVLWSLGEGINSTKSVLFTLLGCLQVACRCRFGTRVLEKRITIHASPSALSCHLYFRRIQILDQIRRRRFECGKVADYCRLLRYTTEIHGGAKGSRMLRCSQYMIRCHDFRFRHSYVLFPTLLPTDMNDVFLSNAWSQFWACTLTCECQAALGERPKGDKGVG